MNLLNPLRYLKGIGEKREKLFNQKGIYTPQDLLFFFPRGFKDYSVIKKLKEGIDSDELMSVTLMTKPSLAYFNKKMTLVRCKVTDTESEATLQFFNMPFMAKNLAKGDAVYVYGQVKLKNTKYILTNPSIEKNSQVIKDFPFLPVHPAIAGVSSRMIVKTIRIILDELKDTPDYLSTAFKQSFKLPDLHEAHSSLHFPKTLAQNASALKRFTIEELLVFLIILDAQIVNKKKTKITLKITDAQTTVFFKALGFAPTRAQRRVIDEIKQDLSSGHVMNRLVQGDVGCGKTAVAFYAMFLNGVNGYQSAMMAPTEVLAKQHYASGKAFFEQLGATCVLVTGNDTKAERQTKLDMIKKGEVDVVFGTHALIYGNITYKNLNLAITDEQHRFGVSQRAKLSFSGNLNMLVMSATPIPRTLALVLYASMDVSVIDEMPVGRKPIATHIVTDVKRNEMYDFIKKEISSGRQAYVVCPLIDGESGEKSVNNVYNELTKDLGFKRVGLLHGRLKPQDKADVMTAFNKIKLDILVSTTVIEVGVDVPNATVMVVEGADRFGLSTLHQLRGRVGRGADQAYCFLVSDKVSERLNTLKDENDGFKIAEKDLELRGPGQFLGVSQHGITDFYMSKMIKDVQTLALARDILLRMKKGEFKKEYDMANKMAKKKYENMLKDIALN